MTISILLPYKENYSPLYAGAVSLFVNDVTNVSKFKNDIFVLMHHIWLFLLRLLVLSMFMFLMIIDIWVQYILLAEVLCLK